MTTERVRRRAVKVPEIEIIKEQVEEKFYDIWLGFFMSNQTPADQGLRVRELIELDDSLPPHIREYMGSPSGEFEDNVELSIGQVLQRMARDEAQEEKSWRVLPPEEREERRKKRKSVGERRHIRRTKAAGRRGTNPQDIH